MKYKEGKEFLLLITSDLYTVISAQPDGRGPALDGVVVVLGRGTSGGQTGNGQEDRKREVRMTAEQR